LINKGLLIAERNN